MNNIIESYLDRSDWRVNENANVGYSIGGLILHNNGALTANYWLYEVYDKVIRQYHKNGYMHIHDLSMLSTYCCGWSLRDLICEGLNGVENKTASKPPKHLSSLCQTMINHLGILQNESAGAQAYSSFDTYLAPFVRVDNLNYQQVKQCIQAFIFGLNVSSRWGNQCPFTNVTIDWTVPSDLKDSPAIVGGELLDTNYGDYQKEMDMINKALIEIMLEGDAEGRIFNYPIITYNVTDDFDWTSKNSNLLFKMTGKFGNCYFANFINSELDPSSVRSMCPLCPDTKVLVKSKQNGIRKTAIRDIVNNMNQKNTKYKVWTGNSWSNIKPIKVPLTDVYKITMSNGDVVKMGENHLQSIVFDSNEDLQIVKAKDITTDMWIPYNNKNIETDSLGDRDFGYVIGAFLGDGSYNSNSIVFSLDMAKKDDLTVERLTNTLKNKLGFDRRIDPLDNNCRNVTFKGAKVLIERYVYGNNALEKGMKNIIFNSSEEFREGVLEGLRDTDGARDRKRLYTSSKRLRDDIMTLRFSLGKKALINYVDTRDGRLGENPNYRIDYPDRPSYGDLYKTSKDGYHLFKVVSIEKIDVDYKNLYCFEVEDDSHLFMLASGMLTHNCRLRLDKRELKRRGGGLFGAGELTGSVGVVTLNMPRIGYTAKNEEQYFDLLSKTMDVAKQSLELKREFLDDALRSGLYPYIKRYLHSWKNHFSTIGLVGMNESMENFMDKNLTDSEAIKFTEKVLDFMNGRLSDYQEETGNLYNLEASPAEGTSYRLAKIDQKRYKNIKQAGETEPYYTNSTQLPVDFTDDVFEALDIQESIQTKYTGGTVLHTLLGEGIDDYVTVRNLVKKIATNYKIPYFTISPTFSTCMDHGYIQGEEFKCPKCGKETEVYARIVGYYRPIKNWNDGKKSEYNDRLEFKHGEKDENVQK